MEVEELVIGFNPKKKKESKSKLTKAERKALNRMRYQQSQRNSSNNRGKRGKKRKKKEVIERGDKVGVNIDGFTVPAKVIRVSRNGTIKVEIGNDRLSVPKKDVTVINYERFR